MEILAVAPEHTLGTWDLNQKAGNHIILYAYEQVRVRERETDSVIEERPVNICVHMYNMILHVRDDNK